MNRIITALALSGMFVAAPAFAKTVHHKSTVATAGDKAAVGDKAAGSETKTTETKTTETASPDASAKPAKKSKKSKKAAEKTEGSSEKPAEAPAK